MKRSEMRAIIDEYEAREKARATAEKAAALGSVRPKTEAATPKPIRFPIWGWVACGGIVAMLAKFAGLW